MTTYPNPISGSIETLPYFIRLRDGESRVDMFVDSSMLRLFSDCERKFHFRYIRGLVPKGRPFAMNIGAWWSKVTEHYYKLLAEGMLNKAKLLDFALHTWVEDKMDDLAITSPSSYKRFVGSCTHGGAGAALLMASEYFEQYAEYDTNHWQVVAVEAGFGLRGEAIVGETRDFVLHWVGKPDLFVIEDSRWLKPVDQKTKDRIVPKLQHCWKPHHQTAGYITIGQQLVKQLGFDNTVDRCVINITARSAPSDKPRDGVKKPRFLRVLPHYSQDELAEWRSETMKLAQRLYNAILTNQWLWNLETCHLYAGCGYRPIDAVTSTARDIVEKANYVHVEPWIPYQVDNEDEE